MIAPAAMPGTDRQGRRDARDQMLPTPYRIVRRRRENHDTFTIVLEAVEGPTHFVFTPGQFNMLYVHGVGDAPISISGEPSCPECVVHTIRAVGAVTRAMARLAPGDVIGVRGPFGTGWPAADARDRDLVIVAGGIGLAPLRPCIYARLQARIRDRRSVVLYGARTPGDLLYSAELRTWARRGMDVQVTVDRATQNWRGGVGVVTALVAQAGFNPGQAVALVCGPEIMMRFAVRALQSRGIAPDRIFLSMERNMKCAVGFCGHCQYGPEFICRDGPVFAFPRIERLFTIREL